MSDFAKHDNPAIPQREREKQQPAVMFTSVRWRVTTTELHLRAWDGECVVFNGASGDTHLINPVAAEVLRSLQRVPASAAQLHARLAASLQVEADEAFTRAIAAILTDFERLGLVAPVGH